MKKTVALASTIGKQVIDSDGAVMGSVKDIMVSVEAGKLEIKLLVTQPPGSELKVSFDDVAAFGEVVLLKKLSAAYEKQKVGVPKPVEKRAPPSETSVKICGGCGYHNRADSKFCIKCGARLS